MGQFDRRKTLDMFLLQLAVMDGEMTSDEAAELYMDKWMPEWREAE